MKHYLTLLLGVALLFNAPEAMAIGGSWFQHKMQSPQEKQQETLRKSCLSEAAKANGHGALWKYGHTITRKNDPQVDAMKQLCETMAAEYLSKDKEKHVLRAQECGNRLREESGKGPQNLKHFQQMQQICEQMTGEKINAPSH